MEILTDPAIMKIGAWLGMLALVCVPIATVLLWMIQSDIADTADNVNKIRTELELEARRRRDNGRTPPS